MAAKSDSVQSRGLFQHLEHAMVELEIRNDVKYTTDEQAAWKPI